MYIHINTMYIYIYIYIYIHVYILYSVYTPGDKNVMYYFFVFVPVE